MTSTKRDLDDGGPAFAHGDPTHGGHPGVSLLDWFATFAPRPQRSRILFELQRDQSLNPHGDYNKPKRRSEAEIVADLKYEYAKAMLLARRPGGAS